MTKAIAPTAMAPILPTPPPVTAESSCCTDLSLRVQAVWNAFLTLLAAIVDWCACQIHGVGKPAQIDDELPSSAPKLLSAQPIEDPEREQRSLVQAYDRLTRGLKRDIRFEPLTHVFSDQTAYRIERAKAHIDERNLLCSAANTQDTQPGDIESNRTRLFLKLGANPNMACCRFVPLHFAVLSGCTLAYEDLRKAGANPWTRYLHLYKPEHSAIELAYHMLATHRSVESYFLYVASTKDGILPSFFPSGYFNPRSETNVLQPVGTLADIQKMIDFEVEKATDPIHAALPVQLARPIAKLIASYYLSGDPNEHGANLVQLYQRCYDGIDPNTKGAQDLLKANPQATVQEQMAMIQRSVETSNELFLAVNCEQTHGMCNRTEMFLLLGANPNKRATLGNLQNFTPLHTAVLTGCALAYKTLRAFGADPTLRLGAAQDGDTCIELAEKMLAAHPTQKPHYYFREFLLAAGIKKKEKTDPNTPLLYDLVLFPYTHEHLLKSKRTGVSADAFGIDFGTEKDLQEILEHERMLQSPIAQEVRKHYELPAGIAATVADYAQEML